MQPAKPSFLEYFEQKEKENQINSFGKSVSGPLNSSDWKVPQDGDYEFVSSVRSGNVAGESDLKYHASSSVISLKVPEHFPMRFRSPLTSSGSSSGAEGLRSLRQQHLTDIK